MMKKTLNLVFPHQLFAESPLIENGGEVVLIEEYLFFRQYRFHKQKIAFHRATMKSYAQYLQSKGVQVTYIASDDKLSDIRRFLEERVDDSIAGINIMDPVDDWLGRRIRKGTQNIPLNVSENPMFLNSNEELSGFFREDKKSYFQTTFYKQQRKKRKVLLDDEGQPVGGKWTYDVENRKKYPRGKTLPKIHHPSTSEFWEEAVDYTEKHFKKNPGELSDIPLYPVTHQEAETCLADFLENRFHDFGTYEDAILKDHTFLHHSVLSPVLNVGLLLPKQVLDAALDYAENNKVPLNSIEGFVRQVMGWREFIRGMYLARGRYSRTRNFWNFKRKIPGCFYDGTTGIAPVDDSIQKVMKTGYCHHIERLMVLGNFMLLCEFAPDEVYRWFMELFIDSYDWVMVPNVYGMSQFADGGTFATKPYIGGSNYIRKMSDYGKGDWEQTWDGLFWRFIDQHQSFFESNPRTSMLVRSYQRMSADKKQTHLKYADAFIKNKLE